MINKWRHSNRIDGSFRHIGLDKCQRSDVPELMKSRRKAIRSEPMEGRTGLKKLKSYELYHTLADLSREPVRKCEPSADFESDVTVFL